MHAAGLSLCLVIHIFVSCWPRQACPRSKDWAFWSKKLCLVFSVDGGNTHRLRQPLGEWHPTAAVLKCPLLVSPHSLVAYSQLSDGTYQVHPPYPGKRSHRHSWVDVSSHQICYLLENVSVWWD
jgi:hypothetical protein